MKTALFAMTLSLMTSPLALADSPDAATLAVAQEYFEAFAAHDASKIGALYQDATQDIFQDPVFSPALTTDEARAMWKLLLAKPLNYSVDYEIQKVNGSLVFVTWTARYDYSMTGQKVVNEGSTMMKVQNGKIIQQTDSFDVCKWFQMALPAEQAGPLCLKPDLFRTGIRAKLKAYMDSQGSL